MNDYQRGVMAGLQIGAPAVARMYQRIVEHPGISISEASSHTNSCAAQHRVLKLERLKLITTRKEGHRRACYPVEMP